jgi:DNA topoisomerase I
MDTSSHRVPGLVYVSDEEPGISRRRAGRGFTYTRPDGRPVRDKREVDRIAKLAVPPAWTDVWICPSANGHILATGRDAKGRKQYKYHPRWRSVRDEAKFDRLVEFGEALPALRRTYRRDMRRSGHDKRKVVATIVALLDCCFARVGNEEYAKDNGSFGLTTLRDRHARFNGSALTLAFRGKGGKQHTVEVDDHRIRRIVRTCQEIPGQELFQYLTDDGSHSVVGSSDVNDYLRETAGKEFSAKDFRTWAGTVACVRELAPRRAPRSARAGETAVLAAVDAVASELGNTRSVCRASYIHPDVIDGFLDGSLSRRWRQRSAVGSASKRGLRAEERFTLAFLKARARAATKRPKALRPRAKAA